jgi:hypothetical protein
VALQQFPEMLAKLRRSLEIVSEVLFGKLKKCFARNPNAIEDQKPPIVADGDIASASAYVDEEFHRGFVTDCTDGLCNRRALVDFVVIADVRY